MVPLLGISLRVSCWLSLISLAEKELKSGRNFSQKQRHGISFEVQRPGDRAGLVHDPA